MARAGCSLRRRRARPQLGCRPERRDGCRGRAVRVRGSGAAPRQRVHECAVGAVSARSPAVRRSTGSVDQAGGVSGAAAGRRRDGSCTDAYPSVAIRRLIRPISSTKRCRSGCSRSSDLVQRPVEVVGDVRELLEQPVLVVRHDPPRRSPATSTANSCPHSGRRPRRACALLVDAPVEILEEREVGGEQALDHARASPPRACRARVTTRDRSSTVRYASLSRTRGSRSGMISSRAVARRIDPVAVHGAVVVDVAARAARTANSVSERLAATAAGDVDGARRARSCGLEPSCMIVHSSTSTSLPPACSAPMLTFDGHALVKLNRAISPCS